MAAVERAREAFVRRAITQHFLVKADVLTAAGAVLAGHDPGLPLF